MAGLTPAPPLSLRTLPLPDGSSSDFGALMPTTNPFSMNSQESIRRRGSTDDPDLTSPISSPASKGRKRTHHHVGLEASSRRDEDGREDQDDKRRQPGVRKACNDCKQQKVTRSA